MSKTGDTKTIPAKNTAADKVAEVYTNVVTISKKLLEDQGGLKEKTGRIINSIAEIVGVKPFWIPIGIFLITLTIFGFLDRIITNCVGFFYPAWQSFKAIETTRADDDRQWLTYWVVYTFFTTLELFTDQLLFWFPFYYAAKILFLLWLFLPQFHGALVIYSNILRPLLMQHQTRIDGLFDKVAQTFEPETKKTL